MWHSATQQRNRWERERSGENLEGPEPGVFSASQEASREALARAGWLGGLAVPSAVTNGSKRGGGNRWLEKLRNLLFIKLRGHPKRPPREANQFLFESKDAMKCDRKSSRPLANDLFGGVIRRRSKKGRR